MKFVSLVVTAIIISFTASAQNSGGAAEKRTVAKVQKTKKQKGKSPVSKAAAQNADVVTLKDEKAYKAKWTFEEMLKRRQEIDAEVAEANQRKSKGKE